MQEQKHKFENIPDSEVIIPVYQVIASRRLAYDSLMWQVPALSFTAQSFLFTIALGHGTTVARILAALLALIIALISMQLMSKHRYHEIIDSKLLEILEKDVILKDRVEFYPHEKPELRAKVVGMTLPRFVGWSSYHIWMTGLALFALASISIIIITFADPALLP